MDLAHLERYRENNRIEAKQAMGGLPESIWETYSAFANTDGGVILLGVEEREDKSLRALDLPDPDWLIEDFLAILNDPLRVSVNLLSPQDISVETVRGRHIILITVPPAAPADRPVFLDNDPFSGSYFRDGEGDFRLPEETVLQMLSRSGRAKTE